MGLKNFGDKFGPAALQGVQGYLQGVRIHDDREDRAERKADRATARERGDEAYQHGLTRRPIADEIQDNQLARDRLAIEETKRKEKFRQGVRKDAVNALKSFEDGNTDAVTEFYNNHIDDGKTGEFVQNKDGSYRHEFTDDITGEAGTKMFSADQMRSILGRAAQSDDEFLSQIQAMSAATAQRKAALQLEKEKQKGRIELEGVKAKGKTESKANQVTGVEGDLLTRDQLIKDYKAENIIQNAYGEEILKPGAPSYGEYFNSRVDKKHHLPAASPEFDKRWPWQEDAAQIPDTRQAPAQTAPAQAGASASGQVVRDKNLSGALNAIKKGKDPRAVRALLLKNGYTEDQLQAAGL